MEIFFFAFQDFNSELFGFQDFDNDLFTTSGVLLGTGALLVYGGVLRYFGFFSKYNILILTLKKSLPNILRFMSCTAVLYAGFLIAGWVIIGPYSLKFRTLGQSSEALFSLLNGDDMFATFFTINETNTIVRIFGTIYIYLFVSLFIYVVLSLFIAIIMDAYEVIRDRYRSQEIEEPSLLQFLAAGQHPDPTNDAEARFQYSSKNLLRL
ncbi:unnamed protein product, partial [Gongylonema pulchrum]|uniref:PKD_channel domain-containing protein n=1 Tax=Gongylonema pulchrum TaxID=637853 RepID=A0A183DB42_9BILA